MAYHLAEEICSNCSWGRETEKDDGTIAYTCIGTHRQYEADERVSFCPHRVSRFFRVASPPVFGSGSDSVRTWFIDLHKVVSIEIVDLDTLRIHMSNGEIINVDASLAYDNKYMDCAEDVAEHIINLIDWLGSTDGGCE